MTLGHRNEQSGDEGIDRERLRREGYERDRIQGNVRSLIDFVRGLEWLSRRAYVALATDVTIGVAAYAKLIETTITSARAKSFLVVHLTASFGKITNAGTVSFQVLVDGVVAKGCRKSTPVTFSDSVAMVVRVPVSRGMHTVTVQWKSDTASATIAAATVVENHAAMTVHEVAT